MAEPLTKAHEANLRHGVKTWGEVPTPEDVKSFFATIDALRAQVARLEKLLRHIRHQADERLQDGHGYEMMLAATVIEIGAALSDTAGGGCSICGGTGKIWETGCEATEYLNWKPCPDCTEGGTSPPG